MNTAPPIIRFTTSTSLSELTDGLKSVISEGCKSILLFTCIDNGYDEQQTNVILAECSLPICGGMFPQIILQENTYSQGAIILGLMFEPAITNYTMLSTSNSDLKSYIDENSKNIDDYQNFIIIADAFCSANENFTDEFYDYIGSGITVVGGGAGSLDFVPRPSIYSNQGLISDTIQVIAVPYAINNEVGHGWEILDGPYLVTASEGHYVHSLNYISAFELYRDVIKNVGNKTLKQEDFFDTSKQFPLGIMSLGGELLVRDPIQSDGSYLECVGNVPVNSTVYLLKGERDKMILSAAKTAQALGKTDKSKTLLLFDCISRGVFMGDDIKHELKAIQQHLPESFLVGVMSLGEITNTQSGAIRLLNKSTVIGSF